MSRLNYIVIIVLLLMIMDKLESKHRNSWVFSNPIIVKPAHISDNHSVQKAYERCHREMFIGFQHNNPELTRKVMNQLISTIPDFCKKMILFDCRERPQSMHCKMAIKPYRDS